MGDLKTFVKNMVHEVIKSDYPNARTPANVVAVVKDRKKVEGRYHYVLRILDAYGNEDQTIAEIPKVVSEQAYESGMKVVVANIRGLIQPYIIGRWYG